MVSSSFWISLFPDLFLADHHAGGPPMKMAKVERTSRVILLRVSLSETTLTTFNNLYVLFWFIEYGGTW